MHHGEVDFITTLPRPPSSPWSHPTLRNPTPYMALVHSLLTISAYHWSFCYTLLTRHSSCSASMSWTAKYGEKGSAAGVTEQEISWSVIHPMRESMVGKISFALMPSAAGRADDARFLVRR